jgi:hypothetical protein
MPQKWSMWIPGCAVLPENAWMQEHISRKGHYSQYVETRAADTMKTRNFLFPVPTLTKI